MSHFVVEIEDPNLTSNIARLEHGLQVKLEFGVCTGHGCAVAASKVESDLAARPPPSSRRHEFHHVRATDFPSVAS